ncbi:MULTISPECIES: ABC transporter ATP-binding protein [unclassified Phaeobacter]|uniref:ABC transporter ATP-binding protein n=1 Tax=unclassified Phaeobacter TaxID=2621772 RepID=UPI003A8469E2
MIRVENLCLWHDGREILKGVSFEVPRGRTLALLGASGSGKTCLARLLVGILPGCHVEQAVRNSNGFRWSGRAEVLGVDMLRATVAERRRLRQTDIGLIVQALSDALNPHQTVLQHVAELLPRSRDRRSLAIRFCKRFNIPQRLLHRYPANLSGGEIQRVLTVLALARDPSVLILDEPTAALDHGNLGLAVALLEQGRPRRSQLLITHDLYLADRMADRTVTLQNGKLRDQDRVIIGSKVGGGRRNLASVPRRPEGRGVAPLVPRPQALPADPSGLVVQDLSYWRNGTPLLRGISTLVRPGHCLAVSGPSGCGKSTLARLISGYEPLQAGRVMWREANAAQPRACRMCELALVSQHPHRALARHMTVDQVMQDAVRLYLRTRPVGDRYDVQALLDKVGLPHSDRFLFQRAADLSGGEAQRLVIARALLARPLCLIADEPTASLDSGSRDTIVRLFRSLMVTERLALIVFTHDPMVAAALGHDIRFLSEGQLRLSPMGAVA